MSHPYKSETLPAPLTDNSAGEVRALLDQAEGNRVRIVGQRDKQERIIADAKAEIESLTTVLELVDKSADMLRLQLGQPPVVLPLQVVQEPGEVTETQHQARWDGFATPETGSFAAVPDLSPNPDKNIETLVEQWDAQDEREGVQR